MNAINVPKKSCEFYSQIGFLIVDEIHCIMAEGLSKCMTRLVPRYVLGLSATPYREDGFLEENGTRNMISNWEKFHGLKPTNKYPKVYYEPEKEKDVKDLIIVDFTSTTVNDNKEEVVKCLNQIKNEYSDRKFVSVSFADIVPTRDLSDDINIE